MDTLVSLFASIDYHDPAWIGIAYVFGFIVWQIGLPPLVGFLFAGFTLNLLGAQGGEFLNIMADIGVTLLLFSIGLKLHIRQLLRPEVWATATLHLIALTLSSAIFIILLSISGLPILKDLDYNAALILAFALSFSSTVFAVKVFEDKGEMGSPYAKVSIGILIVQDIAAVIFLATSAAKLPSPWAAAAIIGLIALKPVLIALLKRAGHGELLLLYGLLLASGGYALFELVSLKGDLGALFLGILVASHPKASELAKSLLSLKDLFLVGFFLSIGLAVTPTVDTELIALLLITIIPLKALLFFLFLTRLKLRTRMATFTSLALSNFSEFGLIVTAIGVEKGWLSNDWLAVMAIAVVLSFILASPLNVKNGAIYARYKSWLHKLEHSKRLEADSTINLGRTKALVCGMGRVGHGAYEQLHRSLGDYVVGIDTQTEKINAHQQAGRKVFNGDASNPDFWLRVGRVKPELETVLLCLPNHPTNLRAAKAIRDWGFTGHIAAITKYEDEIPELMEVGVNSTFNIYAEVGTGFAENVLEQAYPPEPPEVKTAVSG